MTTDDPKQDLIEKAAKAIIDVQYPSIGWRTLSEDAREFRRRQARAALAVFEEAHVRFSSPDGWFVFGSHAPYPWIGRMEFSEEKDEAGMPLWERPADPHTDCKCGHLSHGECYPRTGEWGGCFDSGPSEAASRHLDAWRRGIVDLTELAGRFQRERDEALALIERAKALVSPPHPGDVSQAVYEVLDTAPTDALRAVKADAWDEGWDASERFGYPVDDEESYRNPYRGKE